MAFYHIILFDLSYEIEHFLSPANGKGRNNKISSGVKRFLYYPCQIVIVIGLRAMQAVAVGGFHNNIIRLVRIFRILYERLIGVSYVSGEHKRPCYPVFRKP